MASHPPLAPTPAPRWVRYEGGLGDVVTVQLRQSGRVARFDLEGEPVRQLPAGDAADLFEQRRHFVELSSDDETFAERFHLEAVPEQVERDDEKRIVHSVKTLAAVISARRKLGRFKLIERQPSERKSRKKSPPKEKG